MKSYIRIINYAILSFLLLPCIYGCGGGGAGAGFLGGLFGGGGSSAAAGGSSIFLASSGLASSGIESGGAAIAALHNPEPITMALFGSGMMAMAFYKNRRK